MVSKRKLLKIVEGQSSVIIRQNNQINYLRRSLYLQMEITKILEGKVICRKCRHSVTGYTIRTQPIEAPYLQDVRLIPGQTNFLYLPCYHEMENA